MSPKGTQLVRPVAGLQLEFKPSAAKTVFAKPTQAAPPEARYASATDGFKPDGRKKLTKAAGTYGTPEAVAPKPLTVNGLSPGWLAPAAMAAFKLFTIRSPRTVLALIGRLM